VKVLKKVIIFVILISCAFILSYIVLNMKNYKTVVLLPNLDKIAGVYVSEYIIKEMEEEQSSLKDIRLHLKRDWVCTCQIDEQEYHCTWKIKNDGRIVISSEGDSWMASVNWKYPKVYLQFDKFFDIDRETILGKNYSRDW